MNRNQQNQKSKSIVPSADGNKTLLLIELPSNGPTRCIQCGEPFKKGEPWRRLESERDPEHGSYSVGIHDRCEGK